MEQRFTFNQVANLYRAARPDYPEALIEDVVSYADLKQNDKILEVGCGDRSRQQRVSPSEATPLSRLTLDQKCSVPHVKA